MVDYRPDGQASEAQCALGLRVGCIVMFFDKFSVANDNLRVSEGRSRVPETRRVNNQQAH